ncbi:MAG: hypothetical protein J4F36_11345 [Nitrosopumilaceae archaeon]|nr:hypothetical protein [Nitrosopumilaceae archaeon]
MSLYEENPTLKVLQQFGPITMDRFNDRLRLQKLGFFCDVLGSEGGFNFTYYHYGPYAPTLTSILYKGITNDSFCVPELNGNEQNTVNLIQELFGDNVNNTHVLELYATIWYLLPEREINQTDIDSLVDLISTTKPRFTPDEIRPAITYVIQFKTEHNL